MWFAILLTVLGPVIIAGLEKMNITEFLGLITHVAVALYVPIYTGIWHLLQAVDSSSFVVCSG